MKEMEFWKNWNFCGCEGRKRIREKGKRKRNEKREDIFSNLEFENIGNISSRVKVKYAENISENTEIVRNSSISERLVNFTKNQ